MKSYFVLSTAAHGAFIALLITMGTWLAKPRMGYYSVDLFSLPSGTPGGGAATSAVSAPAEPALKPEDVQRAAPQSKAPPKEAIRLPGPVKKKPLPKPAQTGRPVPKPRHSAGYEAAMRALGQEDRPLSGTGTGGVVGVPGNSGGGGSGIVAEGGNTFPYPWYLKAVADRLDKQWHPPQEFQADTVCQIVFTIDRDGRISESKIEKPSGDAFFDQLAQRAVLYANPAPPLPGGFPDPTLRVHMKFVGKRL